MKSCAFFVILEPFRLKFTGPSAVPKTTYVLLHVNKKGKILKKYFWKKFHFWQKFTESRTKIVSLLVVVDQSSRHQTPFLFAHFCFTWHKTRDFTRPSASLRSEQLTNQLEQIRGLYCVQTINLLWVIKIEIFKSHKWILCLMCIYLIKTDEYSTKSSMRMLKEFFCPQFLMYQLIYIHQFFLI